MEAIYKQSAIPFIALTETFYTVFRKKGEEESVQMYQQVMNWGLPILYPKESTIYLAGMLKVKYRLGLADSFIAALSMENQITLVTKDRDFQLIGPQLSLKWIS